MTDWTDITDNPAVRDKLLHILNRPTAIAVVGAGASASLGYPTWEGLLTKLIDRIDPEPAKRAAWTADLRERPQRVAKAICRAFPIEGAFADALYEIFGPKTGADGRRFSSTHARLLQLPFRGYLTTNYDPGLAEARSALRPDSTGGVVTWRDAAVSRWHSDAVFDQHPCPILWGHGHYEHPESIVLDLDGYRRVYLRDEGRPYRQTFDHLWTKKHLVFVGFGFSDPWLDFLIDQGITQSGQQRVEGPRHVVILGMPEDRLAGIDYHREVFADEYHAQLLAYSTGPEGKDHAQLGAILDHLVEQTGRRSTAPEPGPSVKRTPPDRLATYRQLVADDHSKLHGPLHLPKGMEKIRHACVEVVVGSADDRRAVDAIPRLAKTRQPTLDALLDLPPDDPPWQRGRWLLVGDPGTGKTTLLRRLAAELAEDNERLPVFQPLPSLVAHPGELCDLWEQRFRDRTGHEGLGEHLDAAGRAGQLVLLLDGFDEVEEGLHPRARDLIDGFARRWPTSRIVVSTRPHGRGATTPADFVELSLLPLDDDARADYLRRWFTAAGEVAPEATLDAMVERVGSDRGLDELSRNPLYLTLLAGLWNPDDPLPRRRSKLYDRIFDHLYHGRHKPRSERRPLPALPTVDATLTDLADSWTEREEAVERFDPLTSWLLGSEHWNLLSRAAESWRREGPRRFWLDLWERTQIVGPHEDGESAEPDQPDTPWRFWHRTFREALTAKKLATQLATDEVSFLEGVRELDEGRWAEPLSLLAGRLDAPDQLVEKLMEANPRLGLRALATVDGLDEETFCRLVNLTAEEPEKRAKVYEQIPEQVDDPEACLRLWDRLAKRPTNDLNDVYFLHWLLEAIGRRWPAYQRTASARAPRLYDALPDPTDLDLFRVVTTRDGEIDLWRTIPAGEGWIGSPDDEKDRYEDEGPHHRVTITRSFALAAVPVTNAQWAQLNSKNAALNRPNHPVVEVTWWEAMTFCRWLDHKLGLGGARLPTEEEWEYACRARTETRFWSGEDEADLARVGWYSGNSNGLQPVGQKEANPFGLYDMHGNTWEWTRSLTKGDYSQQKDGLTVDPTKPPVDLAEPRAVRAARGGCCWITAAGARSAYRSWETPRIRDVDRGFRVLLPSPLTSNRRSPQ